MSAATEVVEGVKKTFTAPKKAAAQHFWVFLAIFLFLAMVAFVILERRKPGLIGRIVGGSVGRVPGVRNLVTALALVVGVQLLGGAAPGLEAHDEAPALEQLEQPAGEDSDDGPSPLLPMPLVFGIVRANSFRRKWVPMNSGASGSSVSVTVTAGSPVKVPWEIDKMPTRSGKFHWYVEGFWAKLNVVVDQPSSSGVAINDDQLAQCLHSFELRAKNLLGTVWAQGDTSGARLGLIDTRIATGYEPSRLPTAQIASSDGDTTRELWIWIPFSQGCFEKPHHFAPHTALVNGAIMDLYVAAADVLGNGSAIKSVTLAVIAQCIAMPECHLHTPVKWGIYEPVGQGSSIRLKLTSMGDKKGLNGVLDGLGLAAMYLIANPTGLGLGGGFTVNEINRIQADFLGVESLEFPEVLFAEFLQTLGNAVDPYGGSDAYNRFPYSLATASAKTGAPLNAGAFFYPLLMPGRRAELSKISTVQGTGEIVVGFTSSKSATAFKVGTLEVGTWDPAFMAEAKRIIFGPMEAENYAWVPKVTRKQRPDEEGDYPMDSGKMKYFPWVATRTKARAA